MRRVHIAWVCTLVTANVAAATAVTGRVTFEGTPPEMKPLEMGADPQCAALDGDAPALNEALVLGEGQTMANILVHVSKGLPEKVHPIPEEALEVTQLGCRYTPHVFAVRAGQPVKIYNPDGIFHNVNCLPKQNKPFNHAMPKNVEEIVVQFDQAESPFPFKCNIHPWMLAYAAVFEHPFFAVTGKDGLYRIDGLDPGQYEITAWHERLGTQTITINVTADAETKQDFTFSRPKRK